MAHLFNHARAPWLTQKWVRKVKAAYADVTPYGGYRDDEDQGQMGALGVLMAMGLFEVDGGCAVKPYYEITSPIFDKVTIHLDNRYYPGKTFQIVTTGNSDKNMYIQRATFDGKPWDRCWFYHEDLLTVVFLNCIWVISLISNGESVDCRRMIKIRRLVKVDTPPYSFS